jgi:molybdopterin/thiamine biosynthesis adenylyltransferase
MATVIVIGLGNTGSHAVPHLARLALIRKIIIIDFDSYDCSNLLAQNIDMSAVGRPKVDVQAERLLRIRPDLRVVKIPRRIEDVPLGLSRADLILCCVDSNRTRQYVNQISWRLKTPWVDTAVNAEESLARVNVYNPGSERSPCMVCAWGPDDYSRMEQRHPCNGGEQVASTGAPSYLGALAGALSTEACTRLLAGDSHMAGRQVLISTKSHSSFETKFLRAASCQFDHAVLTIEKLAQAPDEIVLGEIPSLLANRYEVEATLSIEGQHFVTQTACTSCGRTANVAGFSRQFRRAQCPACGGRIDSPGFVRSESLDVSAYAGSTLTLADLGLESGDVFHWVDTLAVSCILNWGGTK